MWTRRYPPIEKYTAQRAKKKDRRQFDISSGVEKLLFKLEPENSLIGINRSHNPLIAIILSTFTLSLTGLLLCQPPTDPEVISSYKNLLYSDFIGMVMEGDKRRGNNTIQFSLEVTHPIFEIGNDLSWEKSADQLYGNNQKLVVDNEVASSEIDNPDTENLIGQRNESSSCCNRPNCCNIL